MKNRKWFILAAGTLTALSSCAQSLSRVEATEVLDKIILKVKSKDFKMPTSYNVTYHSFVYETLTETSISFSYSNTEKSHYSHHKTVTKQYDEDPKLNPKAAYTVKTQDDYHYIDPLVSKTNYIAYTVIDEDRYTSEGLDSAGQGPIVTFRRSEGDSALIEWENKMKDPDYQADLFLNDIVSKPTDLDKYLKKLSSDQDTLVKESEFNSTGEGNIDVYIVAVTGDNEETRTFSFDQSLIRRYEIITSQKTVSASYSWNTFKSVYPNLTNVTSEASQS